MDRRRFWILSGVTIVSPLFGGFVSTLLLNGGSVFARSTDIVGAREFHLTDKDGNVVVKLSAGNTGRPVVHLMDPAGNLLWTIPPEPRPMFVK